MWPYAAQNRPFEPLKSQLTNCVFTIKHLHIFVYAYLQVRLINGSLNLYC